jgi:hypothetical protein
MEQQIQFRSAKSGEEIDICALIKRVFDKFVVHDYPKEGVDEFYSFANPDAMKGRAGSEQILLVAEQGDQIVGMLEMRNQNHLSLLFVELQGQGIARNLVNLAIRKLQSRHPESTCITVNSSPYAEKIYQKLGFSPTGSSQTLNGITFLPMRLDLARKA